MARVEEVIGFYKSFGDLWAEERGGRPRLSAIELCMMPDVQMMLKEARSTVELDAARWTTVKDTLPRRIEAHARHIEVECVSVLMWARAEGEADLRPKSSRPADGETSSSDPMGCDGAAILTRATSFFTRDTPRFRSHEVKERDENHLQYPSGHVLKDWPCYLSSVKFDSYEGIINDYVANIYSPEAPSACFVGRWEHPVVWTKPFSCALYYRVAKAMLRCLGYPEDTAMEEIAGLGEIFLCRLCKDDKTEQMKFSWADLVSEFRICLPVIAE